MKKRNLRLAAAAASVLTASLVLTSGLGNAWAYFTTNTNAEGGYAISLSGEVTTVDEEFSFNDWTKRLVVTNTDESGRAVYVRARAFSGDRYPLVYGGTGWEGSDDGYYYYGEILDTGSSAQELRVEIQGVPEEVTDPESFNVVVVYETTPVQYDADGNPYADWNLKLETEEGGN